MAFTGTAAIQRLGQNTVRITGLSLAGGDVGSIGFHGDTGADVQLPEDFPSEGQGDLSGLDLLQVVTHFEADDTLSMRIAILRDAPDNRLEFRNASSTEATGALEINIWSLHSAVR